VNAFVVVNREQRRLIASVLRKTDAEGEAWFLVTEDDVRYDPDALVMFHLCDEEDVRVELPYKTLRFMAEMTGMTDATTIVTGQYAWKWSSARTGWYPEMPICEHCGDLHVPVLTKDAAVTLAARVGQETPFLPTVRTEPRNE